MEFNLIKIEGKPLEKLIDVISKGVGKLYQPKAIRKEADAKAYEIKVIEEANVQALLSSKLIEQDILDKIQERVVYREIKKQKNIDSINYIAAEQLQQETTVSDEPLDEDWINRFFAIAEDISNEEMQKLWGKILAGEVKHPKSYSLRTLELLRNLNKEEARVIIKVSNLAINITNDYAILRGKSNSYNKYGVTFHDMALLTEIGIIQPGSFISYQFPQQSNLTQTPIVYGNFVMIVERQPNVPQQDLSIHLFTKIGVEILNLIDIVPSSAYFKEIENLLKREGTSISYGKLISREGTLINYESIEDLETIKN